MNPWQKCLNTRPIYPLFYAILTEIKYGCNMWCCIPGKITISRLPYPICVAGIPPPIWYAVKIRAHIRALSNRIKRIWIKQLTEYPRADRLQLLVVLATTIRLSINSIKAKSRVLSALAPQGCEGHAASAVCRYYKFWRLINISRHQIDGLKILEDIDVDVLKKFPPVKYV